jgi:hypothetical protein
MLSTGIKYGSCAECIWGRRRHLSLMYSDCVHPKRRKSFSACDEETISGVDYINWGVLHEMYDEGLEICGPMHGLFQRRRRRRAA